ncbi:unnamed protein product [Rhodiola kirilowii]
MGGSVKDVQSKSELENLIQDGAPVILHFWAPWCEASKPMDKVEAEEQPEISEAYSVSSVPYFVFFKDGNKVDTLEGADPSSLANKVSKVAGVVYPWDPAAPASLGMAAGPAVLESVKELAADNANHVIHERNPEAPQCGFSQKVVDILTNEKVKFGSFDILSDSEVREGLKKLSNWPTYPQLYCKGELLGGCDIVIAMHESGELQEVFRRPRDWYGILCYPQLYINGELIGGSDIVLEMQKSGELKKVLAENGIISEESLEERLKKLVSSSPVMLFMKDAALSSKVVKALKEEGVEFGSFDILSDEEVRQGLKTFSNWPTFPQLYYKGELIGGCDIIMELHSSGDLKATLSE